MISRRWKTVFAFLALAIIGVSVWIACECFASVGLAAEGDQARIASGLAWAGVVHTLAVVQLMVSLTLYLCNRRGRGLDYLFISMYALLMVGGLYVTDLGTVTANSTAVLLALYCFIVAPIPLLGVAYCLDPQGPRKYMLLVVPVDIAAILPLVFTVTSKSFYLPCFVLAYATMMVTVVWCVVKGVRKLGRGGAFVCLGLVLGLMAVIVTHTISAVTFLAAGRESHSMLYGLLLLILGVSYDAMRPILDVDDKMAELKAIRQREEEYRFSSRHMKMFIIRYQVQTKRAYFRPDAALFFGLPQMLDNVPETLIASGRAVENTIPALRDMYARIWRGERSGSAVFGICKKNGAPVWLHTDFTTSFDADGNPEDSIISSYEIIGLHEKEAAYEKWLKTYREESRKELSAYFELDLSRGEVKLCEGELLPGQTVGEGESFDDLAAGIAQRFIDENDREAFLRLLNRDRLTSSYEQDVRFETLECHRREGEESLWTQVSVRMISDPYSTGILGFVMLKDVEAQKRKEARDRVRAQTDELTGLLSRVSFVEQLNELCLASGVDACHAVLMIDLDGFKAVNDTFGHRFGDKVLSDVGGDLRAINRSDDLVARLGGDEFILCLKNVPTDTDFLAVRCRELCRALNKQYGDDVAISGSVGVALYPADGRTFDELYAHADQALYSAKQLGRNRFEFYAKEQSALYDRRSAKPEPTESHDAPAPSHDRDGVRHTLLIVDDQRINRVLLREIFKNDYDVVEAKGGQEALETLKSSQHAISAVVLDLLMPGVSGLDVLRAMNEDAYYQSIPVIVISGADEGDYSLKAIELGASDFVSKPIDEQLVRLRVRNAIIRRESENLRAQNRDLLVQRADETRHQNQLRYMADHDTLTHICNKNAFYRKVRDMIRRRPDVRFCIVCFDVQRFRAVNDIFGHDEGDRLLRFIAMQMRNVIGQDGLCTRAETDNFAFCVEYEPRKVEGDIAALISAMAQYDLNFEVLLSFGVYVVEDPSLPVDQMYDRSEMAKRTVKGSYIKRWAYYDDQMRAALLEEQEIVSSMNAALENGEFVAYYQPKCMLDTGAIAGAEALVRWNHGSRGLLSPGLFIPVFEKNGFIMQLDVYMWEQVCRYLSARLQKDPNDQLHVSVNVSRASLYNPNLSRVMNELCQRYGVPVDRMEVEITESAYVENAHLLRGFINELHRLGFTVEMDDFGSGYSSLNMLKEIPVDVLKLDMRFLYGVQSDERGVSILSSTLSMARQLRLQVIAEGVETEEQARLLASIGCKQAQGFYYAAPMPEADFTRLYDRQPTIDTLLTQTLEGANEGIDRLLCAAAVCERQNGDVRLTNVNEYYLRMMSIERVSFDAVDAQLSNWIGAEDLKTIGDAMEKSRETKRITECVYLQRDLRDRFHLLRASMRYLCGDAPTASYLVTFTDISSE